MTNDGEYTDEDAASGLPAPPPVPAHVNLLLHVGHVLTEMSRLFIDLHLGY